MAMQLRWNSVRKNHGTSLIRKIRLLSVDRVLLTGIQLMRTGVVEATPASTTIETTFVSYD